MRRVVEGKKEGDHPSRFYSFLFFMPVTMNETIYDMCVF